ncbi:YgaP family membrane protein [Halorhabdus salina]|uniref:YgaP family membrane protein n=1 Tax=Halorhabdus salina TaxID=2750670 RepID=UPI0015EE739F|nr:DUF2892 domain-containing protein [Halorhabdus salina]
MEKNVGGTDRQIRTLLGGLAGAVSLAILANVISLPALLSPVFGVIALMMLGTAATGSCGMYTLVGMDTCSMDSKAR